MRWQVPETTPVLDAARAAFPLAPLPDRESPAEATGKRPTYRPATTDRRQKWLCLGEGRGLAARRCHWSRAPSAPRHTNPHSAPCELAGVVAMRAHMLSLPGS